MAEAFVQALHHGGHANLVPYRQVVHCTSPGIGYPRASAPGMAMDTAHYFQHVVRPASAHHVADISTIVRCLTDDTVGYHAPPNELSLGYEICGEVYYTRAQWLSPEVWPGCVLIAAQVRADAIRYAIPIRRMSVAVVRDHGHGQCGHVDVSHAFHESDHTDPGPNFPWPEFMALLGDAPAAPTQPQEDDVPAKTYQPPADNRVGVLTAAGGLRHIGTAAEAYLLARDGQVSWPPDRGISVADFDAMLAANKGA